MGTEMSPEEAAELPDGLNNYLITISDEVVLNCEAMAKKRPIPGCYASISNMAEGLHLNGLTLGYNNNNASVMLRLDEHGRPIAELYGVTFIRTPLEIMWSYGPEYGGGFDPGSSTFSGSDSEQQQESEDEGEGNTTQSLSPEAPDPLAAHGQARFKGAVRRLERVGFNNREDAAPEWGFSNEDFSYEEDSEASTAGEKLEKD
jgi:hypothetical protein